MSSCVGLIQKRNHHQLVLAMIHMCKISKSILYRHFTRTNISQLFLASKMLFEFIIIPFKFSEILFFFFFREIALEILQQEDIGSFIVRDSTTHPGCYALSVRVPKYDNPTGISHYLILKTQRGVKLKVSYTSSNRRYIGGSFPLTGV